MQHRKLCNTTTALSLLDVCTHMYIVLFYSYLCVNDLTMNRLTHSGYLGEEKKGNRNDTENYSLLKFVALLMTIKEDF